MQDSRILPDVPKENRILIDWVSFTTRKHTVLDLVRLLGLENCPFETVSGSKGFRWRQYFNGISIHFNEPDFQGSAGEFIWLEMSGQGCRAFETYGTGDYETLFRLVRSDPKNIHMTRMDIAFDDMTGVFDIDEVCEETRLEHFVARTSRWQSIYSNGGNAAYFGSKQSNVFIRIYDKAAERGYDKEQVHWIRCELQLKDTNAHGFVAQLEHQSVNILYLGVLKNYLSFRVPTEDSNKRRWPVQEWWERFLGDVNAVSVWSKPGVEYNLSACERYVMTQPVGSIKTLMQIHSEEGFLEMIRNAPAPKNPKYKRLISEVETRIKQSETDTDGWTEINSVEELEFLTDLRDSYRSIKNDVLLKKETWHHDKENAERLARMIRNGFIIRDKGGGSG